MVTPHGVVRTLTASPSEALRDELLDDFRTGMRLAGVAFDFDGCHVADAHVTAVSDMHAWRATDRRRAALGQPAVLGVAAWHRDDELGDRAAALGRDAEDGDVDAWITAASDHRADCLDLARRATTALLAASGGGGMDLGHPAQRLAREATFYVIQAQTADGRAATLRRQ